MKLFIKFICFVLVLGLVGPFIIRAPNGQPYFDYREFLPSWSGMKHWWNKNSGSSSEIMSASDGDISNWGNTRVYRWQDANGVWQYSDAPPPGIETETLWLNPNENILSSQSPKDVSEVSEDQDSDANEQGFELPLPLTVAPSEVPKLIEDAKQVQELMQQRNEVLESINGESRQ